MAKHIKNAKTGVLEVSYLGYSTKLVPFKTGDKLNISLKEDGESLGEIVITGSGVIDLAQGRKTPIAVSTIKAVEIQEKGGNFDLPELLVSTPSVVTSKEGGYGDGQMSIRGFSQVNTAFLLNGQPINDMRNGKLYWSNWSGLSSNIKSVQVQRGASSSLYGSGAFGGSINIETMGTEAKRTLLLRTSIGGYFMDKTIIGFGIAGNFAHHLEQAGESEDFVDVAVEEDDAPKGIFPTYIPDSNTFLGVYPFSEDKCPLVTIIHLHTQENPSDTFLTIQWHHQSCFH